MIKSEKQYRLTKAQAEKFDKALQDLPKGERAQSIDSTLVKAQRDAIKSQYEELQQELKEYERLKNSSANRVSATLPQ